MDGLNAFTVILLDALHPAVDIPAFGDEATIAVVNSDWMAEGETIYIQYAGYFEVVDIIDTEHVTVNNLGYPGNANGSGQFTVGAHVVASGLRGPAGATGATGPTGATGSQGMVGPAGSAANFPTDAKGQLVVDTGALPHPTVVALDAGIDGQVPAYDATTTEGIAPKTIHPNAGTDNAIVRLDGATGKPIPGQTSLMSISDQGNLQAIGGNARNATATDLQTQRSAATQVASAATSTIAGGRNGTASGTDSAIGGGKDNVVAGVAGAIPGGDSNQAGDYALAAGRQCLATGPYCVATGYQSAANAHAMRAHSGGVFATYTDANIIDVVLRNSTTNATATALYMDGISVKITPSGGQAIGFRGTVVGVRDNGDCAFWTIEGLVANGPALVAAVTPVVVAASGGATWGLAGNVSVTIIGADLVIKVTGAAANNIRWHCDLRFNVAAWIP